MVQSIKKAAGLVSNANKFQAQKEKLEKLLATIRVTGQSKNGKVKVTVTGDQKIVEINIDPSLINFVYENFTSLGKADAMLSKSIIEAVDNALEKVQAEIVKKMQETNGLDDLMSMLQAASSSQ